MKRLIFTIPIVSIFFMGCGFFEWEVEEPTKSRMEGIWKVTEAYNENGESILKKISFPVVAFQMQSDNGYLYTAEPMFSYIVYGESKYAEIASKFDQVVDYSKLEFFTGNDWFIGPGVVDRFTFIAKIKGFPGVNTLTEILTVLGIQTNIPISVTYHKFTDIKVTFNDQSDSTMVWEFDGNTEAIYNFKDDKGNDILVKGIDARNFSRCKFVFAKQVKTLKELMHN